MPLDWAGPLRIGSVHDLRESRETDRFKMAEMATRIQAAINLVYEAAFKAHKGEPDHKLTAMASLIGWICDRRYAAGDGSPNGTTGLPVGLHFFPLNLSGNGGKFSLCSLGPCGE